MALRKAAPRVSETGRVSGTGDVALLGAYSEIHQSFSQCFSPGDICDYTLIGGGKEEVGYGTFIDENTFRRDFVYSTSDSPQNSAANGGVGKVTFDDLTDVTIFNAPSPWSLLQVDTDGGLSTPSPFRKTIALPTIADMKAEEGMDDGDTLFVRATDVGGWFFWDEDNATAPDDIDTFRATAHDVGLWVRVIPKNVGSFVGVATVDASGTVAGNNVVGAEVRLQANPKTTNPNDWWSILADLAAGALRLRSRFNQTSGVKNFASLFSPGTAADRIELHVPPVLPSVTDTTGMKARSLVRTASALALTIADATSVTAKALAKNIPLVTGFYCSNVPTVAALRTIGSDTDGTTPPYGAKELFTDGDIALVRGNLNAGDCEQFRVVWSSTSTATDDGVTVFRPTYGAAATGAGRWLREVNSIDSTFTSGDATPSVKNGSWFVTAGTTAITDFTNGYEGQVIVIQRGASNITLTNDSTKLDLAGTNITLTAANPRVVLKRQGSVWRLVSMLSQNKLSTSGGTLTGDLSGTGFFVDGAAGTFRTYQYRTAGVPRFIDGIDNVAESGSNVGSDRYIDAVNDGNTVASNVLRMSRATQIVAFTQSPTVPTPALGSNSSKVASTNYVDGTAAYAGSLTRAGIASARIATPITRFYTDTGAPWVRGTSSGPMAIADALGQYWQIDTTVPYGDPHWFGAVGDSVTNDTAAFTAALAAFSRVVARALTYRVEGLTVPNSKRLEGAGKEETFFRPTTAATAFCVKLNSGASLLNLTINGNLVTTVGVKNGAAATESFQYISGVHAQFCTSGFQNWATAFTWVNTSTDSCGKSIDSQAGWNNALVMNHFSRGSDTTGIYMTRPVGSNPNTEQPQAVRFIGCVLFGNVNAILLDTNVFGFEYANSVIDGCSGIGITIAANSSNVHIHDNFLGATTTGIDVYAPSYDVNIHDNIGPGNAYTGVKIRATTTDYVRNLKIKNNEFGVTSGGYPINLDSPQEDWQIKDNYFVDAVPTSEMITISQTYAAGSTTRFIVSGNRVPTGKYMSTGSRTRVITEQQQGSQTMIRLMRYSDASPSGYYFRGVDTSGNTVIDLDTTGNITALKKVTGETALFSVDAPTGFTVFQVANKSAAAVTTKYTTLEIGGYDTTSAYKPTAQFTSTPQDNNNGGSKLTIGARVSDAMVPAIDVYSTVNVLVPFNFMKRTLSTLPTASAYSGAIIEVTDATGGAKICRSNGTNWQLINTTTTVS